MENKNGNPKKLRAATYNQVSPTKELKDELDIHKSLSETLPRSCHSRWLRGSLRVVMLFSRKTSTHTQDFTNAQITETAASTINESSKLDNKDFECVILNKLNKQSVAYKLLFSNLDVSVADIQREMEKIDDCIGSFV